MKKVLFIPVIVILAIFSCDNASDDDPTPETSSVRLKMQHHFNGTPVDYSTEFVTDYGDTVQFSQFQYYLSNLIFIDGDGEEYALEDSYYLVNTDDSNIQDIELDGLEEGEFTSFKISVGVDSAANASTVNAAGDLDPNGADGMIWSWATGYKFIRTEGTYKNGDDSGDFILHLGKNDNYKTFHFGGTSSDSHSSGESEMSEETHAHTRISDEDHSSHSSGSLSISLQDGKTTEIHLMVNVAELFVSPNQISLVDNNQSHGSNTALFMNNIEHSSEDDSNGWFSLHHLTTN